MDEKVETNGHCQGKAGGNRGERKKRDRDRGRRLTSIGTHTHTYCRGRGGGYRLFVYSFVRRKSKDIKIESCTVRNPHLPYPGIPVYAPKLQSSFFLTFKLNSSRNVQDGRKKTPPSPSRNRTTLNEFSQNFREKYLKMRASSQSLDFTGCSSIQEHNNYKIGEI